MPPNPPPPAPIITGTMGGVNKIKFSPKTEQNMINVCHVVSRIEGNEAPLAFKGVFHLEFPLRGE